MTDDLTREAAACKNMLPGECVKQGDHIERTLLTI